MFSFEVDRSRWIRGEGSMSSLERWDGKRCCLGFLCLAAGVHNEAIKDIGCPANMASPNDVRKVEAIFKDDDWNIPLERLMTANDCLHVADDIRERQLTRLFLTSGIKVTFVDGPVAT